MAGRVIVIASGQTERLALPALVRQLESKGVFLVEPVLKSPHGKIDGAIACKLVKSGWWAVSPDERPDKFVIVVDTDGRDREAVLAPIREQLDRLADIPVPKIVAPATRHLEAWFFADAQGLRAFLGRAHGVDDPPDEIANPKRCLMDLLGWRSYTARVSGEIAARLSVDRIRAKSPSYRAFEAALLNGDAAPL